MTPITPESWILTCANEDMPLMQGLMQLPEKYRSQLLKDVEMDDLAFATKYNILSKEVIHIAADLFEEVNEDSIGFVLRNLNLLRLRRYQPHYTVMLEVVNSCTTLDRCEVFTGEHLFLPLQITYLFTNHVIHIQKVHHDCILDGKYGDGVVVNVYIPQTLQSIYSVIIMDSKPDCFFVHEDCVPPVDCEPVDYGSLSTIPLKAYSFSTLPEEDTLTLYLKAVVQAIHDYNVTGGLKFGNH